MRRELEAYKPTECLCGCGGFLTPKAHWFYPGNEIPVYLPHHYARANLKGKALSVSHRTNVSRTTKAAMYRPEVQAKIRKAHDWDTWNKGRTKEDDLRLAQLSRKLTGRTHSTKTRVKLKLIGESRNRDTAQRVKVALKNREPETARKCKIAYEKGLRAGQFPNYLECKMLSILQHLFGMKTWLAFGGGAYGDFHGKYPDFISHKLKAIVEVAGRNWHKPNYTRERSLQFQPYGYKCFVFWGNEIRLEHVTKVLRKGGLI